VDEWLPTRKANNAHKEVGLELVKWVVSWLGRIILNPCSGSVRLDPADLP
jgi:hypothetical protein